MSRVLATAACYLAGHLGGLLLMMALWYAEAPPPEARGVSRDGLALTLYLNLYFGAAGSVPFAALTACSGRWRRQRPRGVVLVSGAAGLVGVLGEFTGILTAGAFAPAGAVSPFLMPALPGLMLGLLVLGGYLAATLREASEERR
jgi:hypothetical protein